MDAGGLGATDGPDPPPCWGLPGECGSPPSPPRSRGSAGPAAASSLSPPRQQIKPSLCLVPSSVSPSPLPWAGYGGPSGLPPTPSLLPVAKGGCRGGAVGAEWGEGGQGVGQGAGLGPHVDTGGASEGLEGGRWQLGEAGGGWFWGHGSSQCPMAVGSPWGGERQHQGLTSHSSPPTFLLLLGAGGQRGGLGAGHRTQQGPCRPPAPAKEMGGLRWGGAQSPSSWHGGGVGVGGAYHSSGSPSRKPLAKGLLAIFSWVICGGRRGQGVRGWVGGWGGHPDVPRPPRGAHPVVLVSRHRHELGLGEAEGLEVLVGEALAVPSGVHEDDVEAGLVAVHGVEDDLGSGERGRMGRTPPTAVQGCIVCPPPQPSIAHPRAASSRGRCRPGGCWSA